MTVKEIFDLRKEGRIEEAYAAIRPMYAAHKGKYTSICMYWTASDIFKLRMEQKQYDEARLIFQALKRMLPYVEDKDGKVAAFIQYAARRLSRVTTIHTNSTNNNSSDSYNLCSKKQSDSVDSVDSCSKEQNTSITSISKEQHDSCDSVDSCSKEQSDLVIEEDLVGHLVVGLDEGINRPREGMISIRQRVLDYIKTHEGCSVPKITIALTIPAKSVERHVAALIADELVEHRGSKKTGGYYPLNKVV